MAKDVVCGMNVDENSARAVKLEQMGKTYYFCSNSCKKTFEANPSKYSGEGASEKKSKGCCC